MRVLLVSNYAPDGQYSMLGFAGALGAGLAEHGIEPLVLAPTCRLGGRASNPRVAKWLGYGDKYISFPRELRRVAKSTDLVHILDQGNSMYTKHLSGRENLLTCHDLLAVRAARGEIPGWQVGPTGRIYQALILQGITRAKNIACVSAATRNDLEKLIPSSAKRSRVILNGLYRAVPKPDQEEGRKVLERYGVTGPFFLHVGGNQPYKNRSGVIDIYRNLRERMGASCPALVMAGRALPHSLRQNLPARVIEITNPSNESLCSLYAAAECLIFPSLYEGFGLPVVEAQALGCPVFASNRAPMTEVGGDAARYFEATEPKQAACEIAFHWPERSQMIEDGYRNAERFRTELMVENYVNLYREIEGS